MEINLYDYQREAVDRMLGESSYILADEMGLGKTIEALAEVKAWSDTNGIDHSPHVLVVTPNSAKSVWAEHCTILLPHWSVVVVESKTRQADLRRYSAGFLIVHWEGLRLMPELAKVDWDFVIADEAHWIKNRKTQRTKALKRIKRVTYRRALSGTPLVNKPDELWSILHWLFPKGFKSYWSFYEEYVYYIEHPQFGYKIFISAKNVEKLQEALSNFTIRRLKKDVLKELPDKYYTTVRLELGQKQAKAYREMKKESLAWLESQDIETPLPAPTVLAQLTRLRQFACGYAEVAEDGSVLMSEPSNKLDALMDILTSTEDSIVVFSQFKQLIKLAAKRMAEAGISFELMTGDTPDSKRGEVIRNFQDGKYQVFMATVQTGGIGITLTAASKCVFLDRSWSPAVNLQAEDRLHRIGQKNAVQIVLLQSRGTVDEAVEQKLDFKWQMIRSILGDDK